MARSPAEPAAGRIALVGASSAEGSRLKHVMETLQVAGSRVDLFGAGEGVVSDYDGEARLIQEADRAALEGHRLVFVCDLGGDAGRFLADPAPAAVTIDLTGAGFSDYGLPLAHDRLLPPASSGAGSALSVPHSLSLLLADILAPLHQGPGVAAASAVILRPAADFGAGAVEELRQQTIHLLNFGSPPVEHMGRQLAFNLIPCEYLPDGGDPVADRMVTELAALFGPAAGSCSVDLVAAPLFYGHGVSLQITTGVPVGPAELYRLLDEADGLRASAEDAACTPMEVNGRGGTSIAAIRTDCGESNRIRLWAAADEAESASAVQAIRLARAMGLF